MLTHIIHLYFLSNYVEWDSESSPEHCKTVRKRDKSDIILSLLYFSTNIFCLAMFTHRSFFCPSNLQTYAASWAIYVHLAPNHFQTTMNCGYFCSMDQQVFFLSLKKTDIYSLPVRACRPNRFSSLVLLLYNSLDPGLFCGCHVHCYDT